MDQAAAALTADARTKFQRTIDSLFPRISEPTSLNGSPLNQKNARTSPAQYWNTLSSLLRFPWDGLAPNSMISSKYLSRRIQATAQSQLSDLSAVPIALAVLGSAHLVATTLHLL